MNWKSAAAMVLSLCAVSTASGADLEAGKQRAAACAACHGPNGEGAGNNPPLAGMPAERFVQAMKDYKSGKRPHAMMKTFAVQADDRDTANLAAYYASLKKK